MTQSNADNKKKILIAAGALALLCIGVLAIRGINAYLTDRETVANTFTVGEVTIDALEPNYPGNGSDETEDLLPNEEVKKDPCIKNTGKNRIVVFEQVDIPMANVIIADHKGNRIPRMNVELFGYRVKEIEDESGYNSHHEEKWVQLSEQYLNADDEVVTAEDAVKCRRIYGHNTVLEEDETTVPVFDVVRLANVVEGQIDNSVQTINITAYAIQADNIAGITSANWTETMDKDKLVEIFNTYMNQSANIEPDEADNSNNQTIKGTTLNVSMTVQNRHLRLNSGKEADAATTILYNVAYVGPNEKPVPIFESSNPEVATVDAQGNIKAVGPGTTSITMKAINPDTGKECAASTIVSVRDMNAGE